MSRLPLARCAAMRSLRLIPVLLTVALIAVTAGATTDLIPVETSVMTLTADPADPRPSWRIVDTRETELDLDFRLPAVRINTVDAGGRRWQELDLDGAVLQAEAGQPGLPVLSRLVAVPAGMSLVVDVVSVRSRPVTDLDLLPVQDPADETFAFDAQAYAKSAPATDDGPRVTVGRPAILAGQTVVSLHLEPLAYDAAARTATVWTDVRLRLSFVPDPAAPKTRTAEPRPLPRSFAHMFGGEILGGPYTAADGAKAGGAADAGLGTYAVVHSGSSTVISHIAPLLQWRREQGYHVVTVDASSAGGSNTGIKSALQTIYDDTTIPPLEFVTIIGDVGGDFPVPSWTESLSGYGGGGDHYYALLDGSDILADVHIARISVRTSDSLDLVLDKILGYEQSPPMDDTSWFGRALVQGDQYSDSGISTVYTNQWLKGQLLAHGWAQVDTTWSGDFISPVFARVGAGVSAYGYRGYWGTSSVDNAVVESLTNGGRLPIAILPTCDSGSFVASNTTRSEAWLRAENGGAVAAIGTATIGTHTRYNNCYYLGTWDALLNSGDYRIGVAHSGGKQALFASYDLSEPHTVEIWSVWNNVMGDGATEMWTSVPRDFGVNHPTQLALGAQAVTIDVTYLGSAVDGARVCLYQQSSGEQVSGLTDATGQVVLSIPELDAGSVRLTVTGHDFLPYQSDLGVGQAGVFCAATGRTLVDDGDDLLNPGETADLTPLVTNHGSSGAVGVTAELTVLDGPAVLSGGSLTFGNITAGNEVAATTAATVTVADDAIDGQIVRLLLTASDGSDTWTSVLTETVAGPALAVSTIGLSDFGGSVDPGEDGRFEVVLENLGSLDATAVSATLTCDSPWVVLTDDSADFGDIDSGTSGQAASSPFALSVSTDCFGGHLATFDLAITYGSGLIASTQCAVVIGTATTDQPTGPDVFGYYAIDNTDVGSDLAPVYDWVEVNPNNGGPGSDLGLTDFGYEDDDTETVALPFDFDFYGVTYSQVSICSNGWLAMGETPLVFFRNYPLPSSHSAGAMIAPFWDDLRQSGNDRVYTWYDESGHRFLIQWSNLYNDYSGAVQDFEVILLDPAFHPTSNGDGMILFQYAQVNNTDARDGYATVGIQNQDRSDGLTYSYWNQYAAGAAPLAAGRAILFAPVGEILLPVANVTPGFFAKSLLPDAQAVEYLHISNTGDEGSIFNFTVDKIDPAIVPTKSLAATGDGSDLIAPPTLIGSEVTTTLVEYEPGTTIDLPFHVTCSSPDMEWLFVVELDLPDGVTVNSATTLAGSGRTIYWNGQTGDGVLTSWGSFSAGGHFLDDGDSADATVNLSFDAGLTGDVVIGWQVFGDEYGSPPHNIAGELVLATVAPGIRVNEPIDGLLAEIGSELTLDWTAFNGPVLVDIDLQRESGGTWQSLATDVPAAGSPWTWTVAGDPGPYAVIRVSDASDPGISDVSGVFAIGRNLDWLQPVATSGQVPYGETIDLAVTLDATGLAEGDYVGSLVIGGNGGAPITIPVDLTVDDTSPAPEVPTITRALGNFPNPFNPQTTISFDLAADHEVALRVYSTRGLLVRRLLDGPQNAGRHHVIWDGRDNRGQSVASGVYFYRLVIGDETFGGKMVLTK